MKKIFLPLFLVLISLFAKAQTPVAVDTIWHRVGVVLPDSTGYVQFAETSALYEGNPQILTGATKVFKNWFTYINGSGAVNVGYAESLDGINWVKYTSNPVIATHCR